LLVEPDPVAAAGRRIDDARESLHAVDQDPEANPRGVSILPPVALHPDAEREDHLRRNPQTQRQARARRPDERIAWPRAGEAAAPRRGTGCTPRRLRGPDDGHGAR